jgi:hypothetical protein
MTWLYVRYGVPKLGFISMVHSESENSLEALSKSGAPPYMVLSISRCYPFDLSLAPDVLDSTDKLTEG